MSCTVVCRLLYIDSILLYCFSKKVAFCMVPFNLTEINTTMERYAFCEYIRTRSFFKRPDKKMHLKKLGLCTCMGIARCLIMGLDSHHSLKFYYCAIFCTGLSNSMFIPHK